MLLGFTTKCQLSSGESQMAFMPGIKIQPDSLIYFCLSLVDEGLTDPLIQYTSNRCMDSNKMKGLLSWVYVYWDQKNKVNNINVFPFQISEILQ